jgi:hypothetical protein
MHLLDHLSNLSPSQERAFEAFPDGLPKPRRRPSALIRPIKRQIAKGVLQQAIIDVLAAATEPMSPLAVRQAVEARLGHSVSHLSVIDSLHTCSRGRHPHFERVGYARYRLANGPGQS